MSDMKDILRRKRERDKSAYQKGFEEGGFAGAAGIILVFCVLVFLVIPWVEALR